MVAIWEWPSQADTTLIGMPLASQWRAAEWRRVWLEHRLLGQMSFTARAVAKASCRRRWAVVRLRLENRGPSLTMQT